MEELLLRIQAILRRSAALPEEDEQVGEIKIGKFSFDYNTQMLQIEGEDQRLTTKENELLFLLCKHRNSLLERTHCIEINLGGTRITSMVVPWTFTLPNCGGT